MSAKFELPEDVNAYLIEKLKEIPNMARIDMAIHRCAVIFGRDYVKILNTDKENL
jgi:hypothetical protein